MQKVQPPADLSWTTLIQDILSFFTVHFNESTWAIQSSNVSFFELMSSKRDSAGKAHEALLINKGKTLYPLRINWRHKAQ